ncbi:MAG: hypothetical protein NXI31_07525 [bacterium]|nr:hypothetical protein [bacterium]
MRLVITIVAGLTAGLLWGCSPAETADVDTPGSGTSNNAAPDSDGAGGDGAATVMGDADAAKNRVDSDQAAANATSDGADAPQLTLTYWDMPG